ncbi:NUDIX hydrolase [Streptomyces sp. ACA25]|uniref:NUDIX domain-containing protein n=1 Tax=Streptomyces sp. ACA25 TaxID=3022596 RepID=UPI0023073AD5|nr:NUDIX hydrolase [Streptomyces sp. ACA25]MDB1086176.1 NUDIX hydrolase [Streptomyces sp. ACA25]
MHNEADFTSPPGRRLGALALFRNDDGQVLLVEKTYCAGRGRWGLPGGCAHAGEPAAVACQREAREELGLRIVPGRVLVVHHMPAAGTSREGVNVVFDGGRLAADTQFTLNEELASARWVAPVGLRSLVAPYTEWRVTAALNVLATDPGAGRQDGGPGVPYLVGHAPAA